MYGVPGCFSVAVRSRTRSGVVLTCAGLVWCALGPGWAGTASPPSAVGADVGLVGPRTQPVDTAGYAEVRYVSRRGSDTRGDGSRGRPWATLARALARLQAATGDRRCAVLVAAGTYPEAGLALRAHVDLFGGYSPGFEERDLVKHRVAIDAAGRNRLLTGADDARIDGFTFRGGSTGAPGGAVVCDRTSPVFTNNVFTHNGTRMPEGFLQGVLHQVGADGGAVACLNYASPTFENNLFLANTTEIGGGAAIGLRSSSVRPKEEVRPPIIRNNLFVGNRTGLGDTNPDVKKRHRSSNGGAIALSNYLAEISNNVFIENSAAGNSDGGAIYCEYEASASIIRNHFVGNRAEDDGGAIYVMKLSEPEIRANLFAGNSGGGAIRLSKEGRARIADNLLFANPGGGIYCNNSWMYCAGNRIIDNGGPGLGYDIRTALHFRPSIIRLNTLQGNARTQLLLEGDERPVFEENFVQGGHPGRGNSDKLPTLDAAALRGEAALLSAPEIGELTLVPSTVASFPVGLAGRVLRMGERLGVVRTAAKGRLQAWLHVPDLRATSSPFEILASYRPPTR